MTVVAVTRGGFGAAWQFETLPEAQLHPLIQYGDPVLDGPDSLLDEYRVLELPAALSRLGLEDLSASVSGRLSVLTDAGKTSRQCVDALLTEHTHTDVWTALLRVARPPPESAAKVLELVRGDRAWDADHRKRRNSIMAEAKAPKTPKEPKEKKAAADKMVGGHPLTAKLDFGVGKTKDKDGKEVEAHYHPEKNNPRRGTAAPFFAKYTKGMTIAQAIEAGVPASKIKTDLERGYVVVRAK